MSVATSEPLWADRFLPYRDALREAASLSTGDLVRAMNEIPAAERERLAFGPMTYRYDCGICETFRDLVQILDRDGGGAVDLDDPRWIVYIYHETPKARMKRADQLHYGPLSNEGYERGLATYRAAGWTGDAPEPNA
jgi:hypothetical protein